ncbi:MAG: hypothetical protein DMD61_13320 [Gemmatimonadetes bacterium]|nr:MAG: hypothetical protein DMD61_13320 [Gemmatimonadota bacterium]
MRRLRSTLDEAVHRYPDDPEAWYLWAEMANDNYTPRATTAKQILAAYQRAIELDSAFAPPYLPAVELSLRVEDTGSARRYVAAERALGPAPYVATSLALLDKLLNPRGASSDDVTRMLDTVSGDALFEALFHLRRWPDSAETGLRLARLLALPRRGYQSQDSSFAGWVVPVFLAYRGHVRQAYQALAGTSVGIRDPVLLSELASVGALPRDSAARLFGRWRQANDPAAATALGWCRVYRALAVSDTSGALAAFSTVPDSLCPDCVLDALRKAQLLARRRRDQEAAELLDREPHNTVPVPLATVFWPLERGRVDERLGKRDEAVVAYRFVADVWRNADPELQPYVTEARAALRRLSGEPRR